MVLGGLITLGQNEPFLDEKFREYRSSRGPSGGGDRLRSQGQERNSLSPECGRFEPGGHSVTGGEGNRPSPYRLICMRISDRMRNL